MNATRSQKIRLAIFLLVSSTILVVSLVYLVGSSLLQSRDDYRVLLQGGSGGLEIGGQVRYNGVVVGRVESVRLNPDNPSEAIIWLSVDGGTPITDDTVAMPEFAGVTGTKLLSLTGGTKSSKLLKPGDIIASEPSDFSMITTKIANISTKLEDLLDNLVAITDDTNAEKFTQLLNELEATVRNVNQIVDKQTPNIDATMQNIASISVKIDQSMDHVNSVLQSFDSMSSKLSTKQNLSYITSTLANVDASMASIRDRVSSEELGATIASINKLSTDTHVAVIRIRDDLRRSFAELERGIENINEFTQILVENPSVLISGRKEKDRALP
ncbi:MAG: MlaD family protein [Bradymonadales bacterium]|jgi:phospholipid/cholesterol/gamma-HCH transport system substrate-binding protein